AHHLVIMIFLFLRHAAFGELHVGQLALRLVIVVIVGEQAAPPVGKPFGQAAIGFGRGGRLLLVAAKKLLDDLVVVLVVAPGGFIRGERIDRSPLVFFVAQFLAQRVGQVDGVGVLQRSWH